MKVIYYLLTFNKKGGFDLKKQVNKFTVLLLLCCFFFSFFSTVAMAEVVDLNESIEGTISPRWSYIAAVDGGLRIDGTTAIVECWVEGHYNRATKSKIIVELQVKNSATNWIPVAIWTDTQNGYEAYVNETKAINPDNTYRVKITATVWEGSQSETTTLFVD